MTVLTRIYSGNVRNDILSTGKTADTGNRDCNRFDAVLHDIVSGACAAPLATNTLQVLVRLIEEQVRTHYLHSVQTISGRVFFPGSGKKGYSPLSGISASIPPHPADKTRDGTTTPAMIDRIIGHSSEKYGVDATLIRAVIRAESDFDPRATSPRGAMGLMQLMPETAKDLGVTNPYDPVQNVAAGTRYLKTLLDRYDGNTNAALAAYNWGMGNVERNPGRLPEETKTYIARVTRYRDRATV